MLLHHLQRNLLECIFPHCYRWHWFSTVRSICCSLQVAFLENQHCSFNLLFTSGCILAEARAGHEQQFPLGMPVLESLMRSKKPWEYADKLVPFVHFTRHVGTAYTSRWSLWLKKKKIAGSLMMPLLLLLLLLLLNLAGAGDYWSLLKWKVALDPWGASSVKRSEYWKSLMYYMGWS